MILNKLSQIFQKSSWIKWKSTNKELLENLHFLKRKILDARTVRETSASSKSAHEYCERVSMKEHMEGKIRRIEQIREKKDRIKKTQEEMEKLPVITVELYTVFEYTNNCGIGELIYWFGDAVNSYGSIIAAPWQKIQIIDNLVEIDWFVADHHNFSNNPYRKTRVPVNFVRDILLYKPWIEFVDESKYTRDTNTYESRNKIVEKGKIDRYTDKEWRKNNFSSFYCHAYDTPEIPTQLCFAETEIQEISKILDEIWCNINPDNYLVVCPNIPDEVNWHKAQTVEERLEFIKAYKKNRNYVIITPTFSESEMDLKLAKAIEKKLWMKVINLQDMFVRNAKFMKRFVEMQNLFWKDRNLKWLNFRQVATLYKLLIVQDYQWLFNDSAPVHIASAASGKRVISSKICVPSLYRPHNWWKTFKKASKELQTIATSNDW